MVIDMHVTPVLFGAICEDAERVKFRKQQFGLYKSSPIPMFEVMAVMDHAKIDKAVLLGKDYSVSMGSPIVSNEELKTIKDAQPGRFFGFAGVDPRDPQAAAKLEKAFAELELDGLSLNLSHVQMNPDDTRLAPIFEVCSKYKKPVSMSCGFSWEPDSPAKYARPIMYEDLAISFPDVNICLQHLGWPWIDELSMMLLKYPNVYTDTATVYMDSPKNYYEQLFLKNMAPGWIQNCLNDKVMYGSSLPRFRQVRVRRGLEELGLREDTMEKIMGGNAEVFLGLKERGYEY